MNNSEFEINKIVGAILLAGVIAMVSGVAAEALYKGSVGEHANHEEKRGYTIAGAANEGEGGAAPAEAAKPVEIAEFMAKADAKAGEGLLKKCTACHTFDKGGKNGVGPNQWALVGRVIASHEGFSYSEALKGLSSKKWDAQALSEFLANPKKYAPGNKMSFAGIKDPQERANLIAYLGTLR